MEHRKPSKRITQVEAPQNRALVIITEYFSVFYWSLPYSYLLSILIAVYRKYMYSLESNWLKTKIKLVKNG